MDSKGSSLFSAEPLLSDHARNKECDSVYPTDIAVSPCPLAKESFDDLEDLLTGTYSTPKDCGFDETGEKEPHLKTTKQYEACRTNSIEQDAPGPEMQVSPQDQTVQNVYIGGRRRRCVQVAVKYALFCFNFIFWVIGFVSAGISFWMLARKGKIVRDASDFLLDPAMILGIVSVVTFIVAFLGCIGAIRENIPLLRTFHICLTVVVLLELIMAVLIFSLYYIPEISDLLHLSPEKVIRQAIVRYKEDEELRNWIDLMQREFRCCGGSGDEYGYRDWQTNMYFNCSSANPSAERCAVPQSCCIFEPGDIFDTMCGFDMTHKKKEDVQYRIYTQGCVKGFGEWLRNNQVTIGALSLAVLTQQVFLIILARFMVKEVQAVQARIDMCVDVKDQNMLKTPDDTMLIT